MKFNIGLTGLLLLLGGPAFSAVPPRLAKPAATASKTNAFTEGESLLYTRVVSAYRKSDLLETIKQRDLLGKNYPASVYLDNAYYLSGVLEFRNNRFGEAVQAFGTVADKFPLSNKRPAALFAKAMTYDKLGLKPQASRLLNQVIKEYPGSMESQRAWMQLKLSDTKKN